MLTGSSYRLKLIEPHLNRWRHQIKWLLIRGQCFMFRNSTFLKLNVAIFFPKTVDIVDLYKKKRKQFFNLQMMSAIAPPCHLFVLVVKFCKYRSKLWISSDNFGRMFHLCLFICPVMICPVYPKKCSHFINTFRIVYHRIVVKWVKFARPHPKVPQLFNRVQIGHEVQFTNKICFIFVYAHVLLRDIFWVLQVAEEDVFKLKL